MVVTHCLLGGPQTWDHQREKYVLLRTGPLGRSDHENSGVRFIHSLAAPLGEMKKISGVPSFWSVVSRRVSLLVRDRFRARLTSVG